MKSINIGDVVLSRYVGRKMTVNNIGKFTLNCVWFEDKVLHNETFLKKDIVRNNIFRIFFPTFNMRSKYYIITVISTISFSLIFGYILNLIIN